MTNLRLGLLIVLLSLAMVLPGAARAQPIDLATYELQVRASFAAATRGDVIGLREVAAPLIAADAVVALDGSSVPVDNQWLADALAPTDPDLDQIAARLGAILDALALPRSTADADAQQQLNALLNNPPFADNNAQESIVERFFNWLFEQIARLLRPAVDAGVVSGSITRLLVVIIGGALLIGILVYWVRGLRSSLVRDARVATDDDVEANITANAALAQANTLAQDGDYRTAVRYLYLSSLLWLDERGMLRYDRALTNREYLARMPGDAALRARLTPIIETFDRVWYGYTPLDAERFAAYRQQVEELRRSTKG